MLVAGARDGFAVVRMFVGTVGLVDEVGVSVGIIIDGLAVAGRLVLALNGLAVVGMFVGKVDGLAEVGVLAGIIDGFAVVGGLFVLTREVGSASTQCPLYAPLQQASGVV